MTFEKMLFGCVLCCAAAFGQTTSAPDLPVRVVNAHVEIRPAALGLRQSFDAALARPVGPHWIGYTVPSVAGDHHMCCDERYVDSTRVDCGPCHLEGADSRSDSQTVTSSNTVKLEGSPLLVVLFRSNAGSVEKIRTFTDDCILDAGGLPLVWLTGVQPGQSVALLTPFVLEHAQEDRDSGFHVGDGALAAIAYHADNSADQALNSFVSANQPEALRSRTAFWLGATRARAGYQTLQRLVQDDASPKVRDKAVFGLYLSKVPEAVDAIINAAKHDPAEHVRGQALFWLAQKAGQRAAGAINEAIRDDPNTEVKKKAVFALSQLPADQGVPLLIQVARDNRNPAVRKQAIFWLGQSHDPRALSFFEQLLSR
jgi:hypothetical protein